MTTKQAADLDALLSCTSSDDDTARNETAELRQKVDRAEKIKRRLSFKLDQPAIPQGSMKTPAGTDKDCAEDEITKTTPRSQAATGLAERGDSEPQSEDDEGSEDDEFDLQGGGEKKHGGMRTPFW